ncbi:MAG TPA: hypothetical protein VJT73_15460 [Polyangiaceae bacterium]|nr:hypothetical protein [Polyangiaceae bacterium]
MSPPDRQDENQHGVAPGDLDPDAPPTEEELIASERLRHALEEGSGASPEWELVEAVRAAVAPSPIEPARHLELVFGALGKPRGKVVYFAFGGVASLAAMAATVALVVRAPADAPVGVGDGAPRMAVSRSAAPLFPEGIPVMGGTTDRVERIALARSQDWRANRFAQWGVR